MEKTLRSCADQIVEASIRAVLPDEAVRRALKDFHPEGRTVLVAAGKAAWQMAHAAVSALGSVEDGVVVTKYDHVKGDIPGVRCYEAGHPVPDANSFAATEKALKLVHGLHPELVKLLGRMRYRTSYGQNVLNHSIEVSHIAGLLAAEIGANVAEAKRAGLLHDLGKSVDHEVEGSHVQIGVELARKYHESENIIHAIQAHHNDVEPRTIVACLVQAADAISAARPGARRENVENYIKRLEMLEEITSSFPGVEKSFAIQAGREVRIMVKPEVISEDQMVLLARDIAKKIEDELEYPGQIKVHLLRETKAIEYAK